MIGLDFVKNVDKDWKKHITYADGTPYSEDYCPLSSGKCRQDDCVFWDESIKACGYLSNHTRKISPMPNRFSDLLQTLIKPR